MTKVFRLALPIAALITGLIIMTIGILQGDLQKILQKAVVICLECIGIG